MIAAAGLLFGLLLAYANGANDNFKGVATLYGSGTATYRRSLFWATIATAAGSAAAVVLAGGLLKAFGGKGLVPDAVAAEPAFMLAVAVAASATVLLATRFGFPISTTHALVGGLVGAGWFASDEGVRFARLGSGFVLPLLLSPALSLLLALAVYPAATAIRRRLGIEKESCLCVGMELVASPVCPKPAGAAALSVALAAPSVSVGTVPECRERYMGRLAGASAESIVDAAHYLSAGILSFARGLNDTPKIAAILLATGGASGFPSVAWVGLAIAVGGLLNARRVAETVAHKVTDMNRGQGLVANLVAGSLVVLASRYGLPVSTTHVSCGAIFGIGAATGRARWKTIAVILLAWVTTLPLAAALGALAFEAIVFASR